MYSCRPKSYRRCLRRRLAGQEGLLEVESLEMMVEEIRRVAGMETCVKRIADFRGCDSEGAGAKCNANKRNGE